MSLNDPLASALSKILNAERVGKDTVELYPVSKQVRQILEIFNNQQYVGSYEQQDTTRGSVIVVNLLHTINKVGAIKPRFSFTKQQYEQVEKRYLPAKDFGVIIVSTSSGIMTLNDAKQKGIGGKLLAYCY